MTFDSAGNFSGTLELEDLANAETIGTLEITKGEVDSGFTKIKMKGTIRIGTADPRAIKIKGRLPTTLPGWTGRTHAGKVRGDGVKSDKYDLRLEHAPVYGFPFLLLTGSGSVRVDGVEETDVDSGGVLLASPEGKLYGEFAFDLEFGTAKGKVKEGKDAGPAKLKVTGTTISGRKVKMKGTLEIAIGTGA